MTRRFDTVLVANRGEIACRVFRTAKAEGYRTVAVYSDADVDAVHTTIAHLALRIGPGPAGQSYLSMERVLEAATKSGAQAIHPGYGFLSENPEFAEACAKAGITFIGPPAPAILALGNKAQAKRLVKKAGVPCVPGYEGTAQDDATLLREAKAIGFPVLLKAAAGGGGRGMRRVGSEADFAEALRGARSEAKNSFGSEELIIERLVEHARHVEIQILADEHGNCIHLGERDCSVQRRHQKIIEESPSPAMTPELRTAMGAAAVNAAKAAGYVNAGTVEFLLEDNAKFYFLEVNTRLQVEHPVTEMITGLDLVALQLRIAQGEALPLRQEDVTFEGHAIEARLCAEDPFAGFAPQVGRIVGYIRPREKGIRIDDGIGYTADVSPYYDSMLAKVIAYGNTRADALNSLDIALGKTIVLGIKTNIPLLRAVLQHPQFTAGDAHTNFIEAAGNLLDARPQPDALYLLLACAALIERSASGISPEMKGWRSTGEMTVPITLAHDDTRYPLKIGVHGNRYTLSGDGLNAACEVLEFEEGEGLRYRFDGCEQRAYVEFDADRVYLKLGQAAFTLTDVTYAPPVAAATAGDGVLKAPMVGQVVRVNTTPGATVAKGAVVVVIEAMKMENQVIAPYDGEIESISVAVGEQVDANQVLVRMKAKSE